MWYTKFHRKYLYPYRVVQVSEGIISCWVQKRICFLFWEKVHPATIKEHAIHLASGWTDQFYDKFEFRKKVIWP